MVSPSLSVCPCLQTRQRNGCIAGDTPTVKHILYWEVEASNSRDVSAVGEVGRTMEERPYADWLSVRFCSSSSALAPPSSPKDTEGWLLEREKREKRMPPMPFPMLAAPKVRERKTDVGQVDRSLDHSVLTGYTLIHGSSAAQLSSARCRQYLVLFVSPLSRFQVSQGCTNCDITECRTLTGHYRPKTCSSFLP